MARTACPRKDAAGNVTGCYIGFCVGGDLSGNVGIGTTLQSAIKRWNGYSRIGFDLDPDNEIYVTVNIAQVDTDNQPNPGATKTGPDHPVRQPVRAGVDPGGVRGERDHQLQVWRQQRRSCRTSTSIPIAQAISLRRRRRRASCTAFGSDWTL